MLSGSDEWSSGTESWYGMCLVCKSNIRYRRVRRRDKSVLLMKLLKKSCLVHAEPAKMKCFNTVKVRCSVCKGKRISGA